MKRPVLLATLLTLLAILSWSDAKAYCGAPYMYETEPLAPPSYSKPSTPYCLSGYRYTRKHNCNSWEIDNYIDEINDYIRDLNTYVVDAQAFAEAAIEFADNAADYAKCEADDAKSELE